MTNRVWGGSIAHILEEQSQDTVWRHLPAVRISYRDW